MVSQNGSLRHRFWLFKVLYTLFFSDYENQKPFSVPEGTFIFLSVLQVYNCVIGP